MNAIARRLSRWFRSGLATALLATAAAAATPVLLPHAAAAGPVNGGLIPDPDNPRRLKYFNGGPAYFEGVGEPENFLYRGTLNANGTRTGDQAAIVNEIKARGLNLLYVNGFIDGRFGGDGPAGTNPFIGGNVNGDIDADVLNQWLSWLQSADAAGVVTFFNIYDDLIDILPGKRLNWNLSASGNLHPQEQKYVDAVVNRLKTLKSLIWCINEGANKTYPASFVPRWKKIAARIRALDTFHHPIAIGLVGEDDPEVTPNTGIQLYATDPNIDVHEVQHVRSTTPADQYNIILSAFNFAAGRYTIMNGQSIRIFNGADGRRKNWATAMAGGYVIQAGEQSGRVWDVLNSPNQDLNQMGFMDNFFKAVPSLNRMIPRNDLKFGNSRYVLAVAGSSYVAYSDAATSNLGVKGLTPGTYNLKWLDTIDGSTVVQNNVAVTATSATFARPGTIQAESALSIIKE